MGILLLQGFAEAAAIPATGADGTLLALEPEPGATYTFEYRTDVHKSWDGRERRVALLGYARESFEAEFFIQDEATFQTLRSQRLRFPTDPYLMVMWHEGATAQGEVASTSVFIAATVTDWATTGRRVWVDAGDGRGYYGVIQSVTFSSPYRELTLDAAPPGTFANGSAVVYPVRAYYLEDQSPISRYIVNAGRWSVKGRALEPAAGTIGNGATVNTLGGTPYLEPVPMLRGIGGEDRPDAGVEFLDAGAKILPETSFTIADVIRAHDFLITSALDRQYWKKFFQTVMGRQKVFLLPTYRPDIALEDVTSIAGDIINATYSETSTLRLAVYGGWQWLRIVSTTGAATTHEIVSADEDGDIVHLTVAPAPPALENIAEIQWIETVRFLEDRFTWTLTSSGAQEMTLRFLVVRQ